MLIPRVALFRRAITLTSILRLYPAKPPSPRGLVRREAEARGCISCTGTVTVPICVVQCTKHLKLHADADHCANTELTLPQAPHESPLTLPQPLPLPDPPDFIASCTALLQSPKSSPSPSLSSCMEVLCCHPKNDFASCVVALTSMLNSRCRSGIVGDTVPWPLLQGKARTEGCFNKRIQKLMHCALHFSIPRFLHQCHSWSWKMEAFIPKKYLIMRKIHIGENLFNSCALFISLQQAMFSYVAME